MGFLSGKKKKEKTVTPESVIPKTVVTSQTQQKLVKSADVRKEIEQRFRTLNSEAAREAFSRKAYENQALLEQYTKEEAGEGENLSHLVELEPDMLIVPGGYYDEPSGENNIPKANLDYYSRAIRILEAKFRSTSSAESVDLGADRLELFVAGFLDNLYNALEWGYAMKANAAIDMIKYVFVVGHRFADYNSPEEREKVIQKREDFLNNVGIGLIKTIDELYQKIAEYRLLEKRYAESLEKYVEYRETFDRTCPKEVQQLIETLGFKGAMSQIGVGDERARYLNMMLELHSNLTVLLESSMMLDANMKDIIGLKSDIDTLVLEVCRAFEDTGKELNFDEHMRNLTAIHEKNLQRIRMADERAITRFESEKVLMARLEEIRNNPKLGESVEAAALALQNYRYLEKKNQELNEQIERRKSEYEVEKKKLQVEKEMRALEEKQQYLNELRQMELEEQEIRERMEEVEEEIESAETLPYNESTVQAQDNRELLNEEA